MSWGFAIVLTVEEINYVAWDALNKSRGKEVEVSRETNLPSRKQRCWCWCFVAGSLKRKEKHGRLNKAESRSRGQSKKIIVGLQRWRRG